MNQRTKGTNVEVEIKLILVNEFDYEFRFSAYPDAISKLPSSGSQLSRLLSSDAGTLG